MRVLGADLRELDLPAGEANIVVLDETGGVAATAHASDLPAFAREVARLASGEPFVLAVDVPVVGPAAAGKPRRVDGWVHRRLGVRLPFLRGGTAPSGTALLAALATAGHPCLPYPDRDRRQPGLAEIHPELVLKSILWESSIAATAREIPDREAVLRALAVPSYRGPRLARATAAERFAAVDLALRVAASTAGFDVRPAREELGRASTEGAVARAASLLDAALLAGTARRYLEEPERCAFVGAREHGYTILPADAFVRRIALKELPRAPDRARLFPRATLHQRLGDQATVRPLELLDMGGRAQRIEAIFETAPLYEFDNVDEMMWWKHCRHLAGPDLPVEGLDEMVVRLEPADGEVTLRLVRSRHKTLSFRFEPPSGWRLHLAPRDGKTYAFRVLRAVFEADR
jgi:hypothetical protein